jgi:hypothetical protein
MIVMSEGDVLFIRIWPNVITEGWAAWGVVIDIRRVYRAVAEVVRPTAYVEIFEGRDVARMACVVDRI